MAKFIIDPNHSAAVFSIRHMMVTWVHGQFNKVSGTLHFDSHDIVNSSVEAEIDAASIYTGVDMRDHDLRSPNYFDVEKYPKINFKSAGTESGGLDRCLVHGDLTIHGVTRPATLDVAFAGPSRTQREGKTYTVYGFQVKTRINREDFGITTNIRLENGGFMLGKHVYLTINAEAGLVEE